MAKFWRYLRRGTDYVVAAMTGSPPGIWRDSMNNQGTYTVADGGYVESSDTVAGRVEPAAPSWFGAAMLGTLALGALRMTGLTRTLTSRPPRNYRSRSRRRRPRRSRRRW